VHINLWAEIKFLLECLQFIERTKRAAESKIEVVRFRIIPGDWGKAGSGWLTRLLKTARKFWTRQNSPVPLAVFAHRQMRMRDLAASRDEKPRRVESSSPAEVSGSGRIAVTQRVNSCYCASARCGRLWRVSIKIETAQRKTPKGGQKERTHREDHGNSAGSVKNFQAPAMLKTTPLDCEIERQLEREEARPVVRANAPSKAVADPEPVVKTRIKSQACLDLVGRPVAQPPAEAS
jgi:hypothetical protein